MKARIQMSKKQEQAMKKEIRRQIIIQDEQHANDLDTVILYTLHSVFGFGKKRLRRFYDGFVQGREELADYYEMPDDVPFLCDRELKRIGVDVAAWNKERENKCDNTAQIK